MLSRNENIRNIAIIAHVDHGKTTLVDALFRQSGVFRENAQVAERVMDNMDLERERGITISAKNCSVFRGGTRINIVDTPGHADFGGEVERALMMVDGVILLVDAAEGPLPQTRFVLHKALEAKLKIIVCINKIDRHDAQPKETLNSIYDLFIDLDATEDQLDFPVLYTIGRSGIAQRSLETPGTDLEPLFDTIIKEIPAPAFDPDEPFQMLVANLGYSDYLGRLAIGKVIHGNCQSRQALVRMDRDGSANPLKVVNLQVYNGINLENVTSVTAGDIVVLAGVDEVEIGDTICTEENPKALPRIHVDEPTVAMTFRTNTSPFAGQDGKFLQTARIAERLNKETLFNVALQVEKNPDETFVVKGRGEFQLAILIETMRREGFELAVGRPRILFKEIDGKTCEPVEHLVIDCDEPFLGVVTQKLSVRKARMVNLVNHGFGRVRVEFSAPTRALIGYRSEFLTDTKGTGLMSSYLTGFEEYRGDFPSRTTGSLVADREGETVTYGLFNLEPRGTLFVGPNTPVYEGMIVGEHCRDNDLNVNPCRGKKLTNMRAAGKDELIQLTPHREMTLEKALEFIRDDEMVEVTPLSIRLRKTILPASQRK